MNALGNILKHHRRAAKVSQQGVADSLGIDVSSYRRWEHGDIADIKFGYILKLSKLYGITPNDFTDLTPTTSVQLNISGDRNEVKEIRQIFVRMSKNHDSAYNRGEV